MYLNLGLIQFVSEMITFQLKDVTFSQIFLILFFMACVVKNKFKLYNGSVFLNSKSTQKEKQILSLVELHEQTSSLGNLSKELFWSWG